MNEPRHGGIVSGEVIPPQTYLHKVAAAKHDDQDDDGPVESTASAEDAPEDTAAADDSHHTYDADDEGDEGADAERPGATLTDTRPDLAAADATQPGTGPDTGPDGEDTAIMSPARTDTVATESPIAGRRREGRPGDVPMPEDVSLIGDGAQVREQWMRVQASFVDDPRAAVTSAAGVITDAIAQVETAVRERQQALRDRWDGDGHADTEALRVVMQQYRQLLERLAAL